MYYSWGRCSRRFARLFLLEYCFLRIFWETFLDDVLHCSDISNENGRWSSGLINEISEVAELRWPFWLMPSADWMNPARHCIWNIKKGGKRKTKRGKPTNQPTNQPTKKIEATIQRVRGPNRRRQWRTRTRRRGRRRRKRRRRRRVRCWGGWHLAYWRQLLSLKSFLPRRRRPQRRIISSLAPLRRVEPSRVVSN